MRLLEFLAGRPVDPPGLEPIRDARFLSPLTRMLLVTDGTMTDAVEAYTLESCTLVKLNQTVRRLGRPFPPLELDAGSRVLERTITMRGARSGKTRFLARTVFAVGRLGRGFLSDLERTDLPLGDILRRRAPSARRDVLGVGLLRALPRGPLRRSAEAAPCWVVRTYRLRLRGTALAVVTEYLPESGRCLCSRTTITRST